MKKKKKTTLGEPPPGSGSAREPSRGQINSNQLPCGGEGPWVAAGPWPPRGGGVLTPAPALAVRPQRSPTPTPLHPVPLSEEGRMRSPVLRGYSSLKPMESNKFISPSFANKELQ